MEKSKVAYFSLFTGLCLANVPKCIKLFALIWACHNFSFTWSTVTVWNVVLVNQFSPWRWMFNSFKRAVKFTKNAKSVSQFSSSKFQHKFFWYHKWLNDIATHKIFSIFGLDLTIFHEVNGVTVVSFSTFKEFLELVMIQSLGSYEIQSWWWFAWHHPFLKLLCLNFLMYYAKHEFQAAIAPPSINFTSPSLLPTIAQSVTTIYTDNGQRKSLGCIFLLRLNLSSYVF